MDDIILSTSSYALCQSIMAKTDSEFAMKDSGQLRYFLSVSITRHTRSVFLIEEKYVEKFFERTSMSSCKPSTTLVDKKSKLNDSYENSYYDPNKYRNLIETLILNIYKIRCLLCRV